MIEGTLAAAATPLRNSGHALDEAAFAPLVEFFVGHGLDGILTLGTTGEGILLGEAERRRVTELFVAASDGRLGIAAHCGAQTTAETVALAAHAAELGVDGVAVIGPPYFVLDDEALLAHFAAAARACAPTPFYVYELERASGYQVPLEVIASLREQAANFVGMKVSDTPWERFAPYLLDGLEIFVGPESLIHRGLAGGAVGAVSALATAFPELVGEAVRSRTEEATATIAELRAAIDAVPRHAALKYVLGRRGVPIAEDVRAPLRGLTDPERRSLDRLVDELPLR